MAGNEYVYPIVKPEGGTVIARGLTRREMFAMAAMQGMLAVGDTSPKSLHLGEYAVAAADNLIEALDKKPVSEEASEEDPAVRQRNILRRRRGQ